MFLELNQDSRIWLNSLGFSIMAACPHLSIQNKSELGNSLWKSLATSGGVTESCFPQLQQVGCFLFGKSSAILCLIALFAIVNVFKTVIRLLTIPYTSSTSSLVAIAGS